MRILIAIFAAIMIVACSSTEKQSGPPPSEPPSSPQPSGPPSPDMPDSQNFEVFKTETCESGTDSRTLEVHKKKVGCDLSYTRFGKEKIVSSGKHGTKRCEKSMDKIMKKLKAQKYTCTP